MCLCFRYECKYIHRNGFVGDCLPIDHQADALRSSGTEGLFPATSANLGWYVFHQHVLVICAKDFLDKRFSAFVCEADGT